MKIATIGAMPSDLEFGCFATLSKYIRQGHDISIIIAKDSSKSSLAEWDEMSLRKFKILSRNIGITGLYVTDRFDYSAVTQDNADVLNSLIKMINPSLIIMPFWKATHNKRRVLAKTSLIACRGFGNIFMYELEENKDFNPTIYFQVSVQDAYVKKCCLSAYCGLSATTNEDEYNVILKKTIKEINLASRKGYQLLSLSQERSEVNHGISKNTKYNDIYDADGAKERSGYLNYPVNTSIDKPETGRKSSSSLQQIILRYTQNFSRRIPIEVFESHRMLLVETGTGF